MNQWGDDRTPEERAVAETAKLNDRLAGVDVRLQTLDSVHRRNRALGPALLLVLANVTPLVAVTASRDPTETYTLFQLIRHGVASGRYVGPLLFVLIAIVGLVLLFSCTVLSGRSPSKTGVRVVVVAASLLLLCLLALILNLAVSGYGSTSFNGLQPATVLGAAAAVWLLLSCLTVRD